MNFKNLEDAKNFGKRLTLTIHQIEHIKILINKIENRSSNSVSTLRIYYGQDGSLEVELPLKDNNDKLVALKGLQTMLSEYNVQLNELIGGDICDF